VRQELRLQSPGMVSSEINAIAVMNFFMTHLLRHSRAPTRALPLRIHTHIRQMARVLGRSWVGG
jgi:hypothetical protein